MAAASSMPQEEEDSFSPLECAVCLQSCVHPVQLDCRHIFCFLCVKGVAIMSKRCPMCRAEIPSTFLQDPTLVTPFEDLKPGRDPDLEQGEVNSEGSEVKTEAEEEQGWYYEGRNGWWEYDPRTTVDLEAAYKRGDQTCELLIAGFLYTIDFQGMFQCRRNEPNRKRSIKRDVRTIAKKGIAGLRIKLDPQPEAGDPGAGSDGVNSGSQQPPNPTSNPNNTNGPAVPNLAAVANIPPAAVSAPQAPARLAPSARPLPRQAAQGSQAAPQVPRAAAQAQQAALALAAAGQDPARLRLSSSSSSEEEEIAQLMGDLELRGGVRRRRSDE